MRRDVRHTVAVEGQKRSVGHHNETPIAELAAVTTLVELLATALLALGRNREDAIVDRDIDVTIWLNP